MKGTVSPHLSERAREPVYWSHCPLLQQEPPVKPCLNFLSGLFSISIDKGDQEPGSETVWVHCCIKVTIDGVVGDLYAHLVIFMLILLSLSLPFGFSNFSSTLQLLPQIFFKLLCSWAIYPYLEPLRTSKKYLAFSLSRREHLGT